MRFPIRVTLTAALLGTMSLTACGSSKSSDTTVAKATETTVASETTAAASTESTAAAASAETTAAKAAAGSDVVKLGFQADMQVPDPDVFYETEGLAVVTSVYEGLLRYKPDTAEVEPALAESYTVSPDGLTYTFKLRSGVKFHDGTVMDSAAAQSSFERRTKVNSGPAYMLADVASYETPDPSTFVVKLKQPVSAFTDYLASPYGPKLVSPKTVTDNAGTDMAQSYLKTHDAGTGPFTISKFVPSQNYELTRFDGYWGGAAKVAKIEISILPDISTQRLKLESGDLSMILHGLSVSDIDSLGKNAKFQVKRFQAAYKTMVFVNENKGVFKDPALRTALRSAIDKKTIVDQVLGEGGTVSTQMYPATELAPDLAKDDAPYDAAALTKLVGALPDKKLDIVFQSDSPGNQRMADLLQAQLQAVGFKATTRGLPIPQLFDFQAHPETAPDLLLATVNGDGAHPDTWIRIFMNSTGPLNFLKCSVPAADAAMDEGLHATDAAKVAADYGKAGDLVAAAGCFVTIADVKESIVAEKSLGNIVHQLPTLQTIRFGDLTVG